MKMNAKQADPDWENRIFKKILGARKMRKGNRSYWFWPDGRLKERGVVCDLLEAMEYAGVQHGIIKVRSCVPDPPDDVGITKKGKSIAFEATELVDAWKEAGYPWKKWSSEELIAKLRAIISEKDGKNFHGGPYSKKVLVIHTDEPLLCHLDCGEILRGQNFGLCRQISEVYLLFPPDPAPNQARSVCPFLRLKI